MSSKQISTAAVDPHVSIQIARLTESQEAELALIRLFAAERMGKLVFHGKANQFPLSPVNPQVLRECR